MMVWTSRILARNMRRDWHDELFSEARKEMQKVVF
jgi:hypothetical protein